MITEDYVSFETAKLLKEKGFKGECLGVYFPNGRFDTFDTAFDYNLYDGNLSHAINAPTLQMATKWLRKVHHIIIVIQPLSFNGAKDFLCDNWVYSVWLGANLKIGESLKNQNTYSTYEQACEAAIKYCLENLI